MTSPGGDLPPGLILYSTYIGVIRKEKYDCRKLRWLFDSLKLQYHEADVGDLGSFVRGKLSQKSNKASLPQVFFGNTFIGTYDDIQEMQDEGIFLQRLKEVGYVPVENFRRLHPFTGLPVDMDESIVDHEDSSDEISVVDESDAEKEIQPIFCDFNPLYEYDKADMNVKCIPNNDDEVIPIEQLEKLDIGRPIPTVKFNICQNTTVHHHFREEVHHHIVKQDLEVHSPRVKINETVLEDTNKSTDESREVNVRLDFDVKEEPQAPQEAPQEIHPIITADIPSDKTKIQEAEMVEVSMIEESPTPSPLMVEKEIVEALEKVEDVRRMMSTPIADIISMEESKQANIDNLPQNIESQPIETATIPTIAMEWIIEGDRRRIMEQETRWRHSEERVEQECRRRLEEEFIRVRGVVREEEIRYKCRIEQRERAKERERRAWEELERRERAVLERRELLERDDRFRTLLQDRRRLLTEQQIKREQNLKQRSQQLLKQYEDTFVKSNNTNDISRPKTPQKWAATSPRPGPPVPPAPLIPPNKPSNISPYRHPLVDSQPLKTNEPLNYGMSPTTGYRRFTSPFRKASFSSNVDPATTLQNHWPPKQNVEPIPISRLDMSNTNLQSTNHFPPTSSTTPRTPLSPSSSCGKNPYVAVVEKRLAELSLEINRLMDEHQRTNGPPPSYPPTTTTFNNSTTSNTRPFPQSIPINQHRYYPN